VCVCVCVCVRLFVGGGGVMVLRVWVWRPPHHRRGLWAWNVIVWVVLMRARAITVFETRARGTICFRPCKVKSGV
jgi:hypothetical protein